MYYWFSVSLAGHYTFKDVLGHSWGCSLFEQHVRLSGTRSSGTTGTLGPPAYDPGFRSPSKGSAATTVAPWLRDQIAHLDSILHSLPASEPPKTAPVCGRETGTNVG